MIVHIKNISSSFVIGVSFMRNEKELPIREALQSESETQRIYNIVCKDSLFIDLWESERIFSQFHASKTEVEYILKNVEKLQSMGIAVKIPLSIQASSMMEIAVSKRSRNKLTAKISIDGCKLSKQDIETISRQLDDFIFFNGKWQLVDCNIIKNIQEKINSSKAELIDLIRILQDKKPYIKSNQIVIKNTHNKGIFTGCPEHLNATLRDYQSKGLKLLYGALKQNRNVLLADDMGLGKTIQCVALLNMLNNDGAMKVLVVAPKSLIYNWQKEINQFAPRVSCSIVKNKITTDSVQITTYGHLVNNRELYQKESWKLVIIDEAQQIKNSKTMDSEVCCSLTSNHRIALTGTPVENSIVDLWGLFKFLEPTLFGTLESFKKIRCNEENYNLLQQLIEPYIIRRVKTDKSIIDLPDKINKTIYCGLTDAQVMLYNGVLEEFEKELWHSKAYGRRTTILKYINTLKSVCNHPASILNTFEGYTHSGKLKALKSYLMRFKQDKIIVFTQYRKMSQILRSFLTEFYGKEGLLIDGDMAAKKRKLVADQFQKGNYPFIVITLKAGGTGLTLTQANHVIHYDRWWNPSVENQATDRAHRIGQLQDVNVVTLICRGTLEDRIDQIHKNKTDLFDKVISPLNMSNDELLKFVQIQT